MFATLIAKVGPNAAPGCERSRFEYIYKVDDVFTQGRLFSHFAGISSIKALLIISRGSYYAVYWWQVLQHIKGATTMDNLRLA